MESHFSKESQATEHSHLEFQNLYSCQKIIRDWNSHPEWSSYDMIPILYTALHTGKRFNPGAKSAPKLSEVVRNSDSFIEGYTNKKLPPGEEVYLLTSKFSNTLDDMLKETPKTLEKAVEDAALAYYVLCRIHPFPDGNGRVGRMIAKLIFKRSGLKDPVFHDQRWYGGDRSEHLEAIEKVDETNNIAHMELFFAKSLVGMYSTLGEFGKHREVSKLISEKEKQSKINKGLQLSDIWEGFTNIPPYEPRNK